jgi:NAD(P)-dependent dehydrogenase (short-subunit alcohol dehydrogenase family)
VIPINLAGRVILVCGVARGGIGGATARRIAEAGATVFAVDRTRELLDVTLADIERAGGKASGLVADLTDPAQSDPIIGKVIERHGRLDGVANVAGGTRDGEWMCLEDTPTQMFRETFLLNLEYVFRICRDAATYMIDNKVAGSLVNVGSISGLTSAPFHGPYGAAKSGIFALTRTMAIEWKPYGIRANTVSPGAVATERIRVRPGVDGKPVPDSAFAGFNTPDDLAYAILFLLSDLAAGISGQNLVVDHAVSANHCTGAFEKRRPDMLKAKGAK